MDVYTNTYHYIRSSKPPFSSFSVAFGIYIYISICLSIYLSVYLSIYLSTSWQSTVAMNNPPISRWFLLISPSIVPLIGDVRYIFPNFPRGSYDFPMNVWDSPGGSPTALDDTRGAQVWPSRREAPPTAPGSAPGKANGNRWMGWLVVKMVQWWYNHGLMMV